MIILITLMICLFKYGFNEDIFCPFMAFGWIEAGIEIVLLFKFLG